MLPFSIVLKRLTIRSSIVGTRKDLQEALDFSGEGKVRTIIEAINGVFDRLSHGQVQGRVVLQMG